jgi:hypothetical protein
MTFNIMKIMPVFAGWLLCAGVAWGLPAGDQFRVNEQSAGTQWFGPVAASANGDSVIGWTDAGSSFVQRYDAAGRASYRGGLRVNSGMAAIGLDDGGNLVVVDQSSDALGSGIFAAVYNRSGAIIVPRFRVSSTSPGNRAGARVAVNGAREIVISWVMAAPGTWSFRPVVRRFRADGTPVTGEIFANAVTQGVPAVAIDQSGNFVLTYAIDRMGEFGEVYLRRFDAFGNLMGPELRVNAITSGVQRQSRIAMERSSGQFIVVWESYEGGEGWRVKAQRFTRDAWPIGTEFRIDTTAPGIESVPEVAMADDGSFVVSWTARSSAGFQFLARSYSPAGVALDGPFVVRSGPRQTSATHELGMDPAGNFMLTWSGEDNGTWDAYARRYVRDGVVISPIANGQSISGISGLAPQGTLGEFKYYKVTIPAGTTRMQTSISGGAASGDADLYLRYGLIPSTSAWNARPYLEGSNESIVATQPSAGDWYIGVHAYTSFSGVTLSVSYQ